MAFCEKCGTEVFDGSPLCPSCKAAKDANATSADAQNDKLMAILAYFGILVLIPILAAPQSKFARFHANQGLILMITALISCAASIILVFIPIIGWIISFALPIALLVFAILGIVNAATGKTAELPLIGKFRILH